MMLLNLISPQMREALRQHVLSSAVRTLVVVIIGVEVLFAGALFTGDLQLKAKTKSLQQEAERSSLLLRSQGQATVADTTKLLNSQITALQSLQKRYVSWLPVFQTFSALTPPGISLQSIDFNQKTGRITFQGVAETRESYTQYEKVLQGSPLLANVTFPLQTKKTGLSFNISAAFKTPQ